MTHCIRWSENKQLDQCCPSRGPPAEFKWPARAHIVISYLCKKIRFAKVQWPPSGVKREGDLTFDPLGEDSNSAWATESKTSVPTFSRCKPSVGLSSPLERRTNGYFMYCNQMSSCTVIIVSRDFKSIDYNYKIFADNAAVQKSVVDIILRYEVLFELSLWHLCMGVFGGEGFRVQTAAQWIRQSNKSLKMPKIRPKSAGSPPKPKSFF